MNQQGQPLRQFFVALLAAVWIHVGLIFIFVLLLVFEVLAAKEIDEEVREEEPKKEDFSELVLSFEEDTVVDAEVVAPAPMSPPSTPEEKFAQTREDQASTPPIETEFIGERDTKASSDAGAMAGEKKSVALAGEEKQKQDIKTFDSEFSDGEAEGPESRQVETRERDLGEDELSENSDKFEDSNEASEKEMKPAQDLVSEQKAEDFVDIDGVIKTIEDAVAREEKRAEAEMAEKPEIKVVNKKKEARRDGGFNSQTSKTKVKGVLSVKGIGALDVKNSAVGAYGSHIFREIEREWQMGNFRYRSHIAPGHITLYFVVDKKGNVSRQKQLEIRGASGMQWGIVLNSVTAAKIPAMSKEAIEELGGEDLELTMGFTYN